jgi:hypothetical protein
MPNEKLNSFEANTPECIHLLRQQIDGNLTLMHMLQVIDLLHITSAMIYI